MIGSLNLNSCKNNRYLRHHKENLSQRTWTIFDLNNNYSGYLIAYRNFQFRGIILLKSLGFHYSDFNFFSIAIRIVSQFAHKL